MISRRMYYVCKAVEAGASVFTAMEAVSSVAIEHPEWDMAEEKGYDDWEREHQQ